MSRTLLFLLLFPFPAPAQDTAANPIGATILPNADLVLFDAPPNGAFTSQPIAQAILQPSPTGNTLFALQPDSKAPSGYNVTGQTATATPHLRVTDFVDVYQDKALNRWVQISPLDQTSPSGWVMWGQVGQAPQGFTVTEGN